MSDDVSKKPADSVPAAEKILQTGSKTLSLTWKIIIGIVGGAAALITGWQVITNFVFNSIAPSELVGSWCLLNTVTRATDPAIVSQTNGFKLEIGKPDRTHYSATATSVSFQGRGAYNKSTLVVLPWGADATTIAASFSQTTNMNAGGQRTSGGEFTWTRDAGTPNTLTGEYRALFGAVAGTSVLTRAVGNSCSQFVTAGP